MKDEGCGIGIGFRPGGARRGGPGEGVPTGPPAAYGFVTKEVSDTMESMGSRKVGCFPARFEDGESPVLSVFRPLPFLGNRGDGAPGSLGSLVAMLVVVTGGWLWKRQKMW